MEDIFISYRRDDAKSAAGRLYDRLSQHFGENRVFMDVDDIAAGSDFFQTLQFTLQHCSAVLVVIGRDWTGRDQATGRHRIDDPDDFVHIEVRAALERGIPVLPVLVDGAGLPPPDRVPVALQPLLRRQAVEIRHARFREDADHLAAELAASIGGRRRLGMPRGVAIGLLVAALIVAAGIGYWRLNDALQLRAEPAQISAAVAQATLVRLNFYDARRNPGGAGHAAEFRTVAIGDQVVVVDRAAGLMWQNGDFAGPLTQPEAGSVIDRLNAAGYGGASDWRLPTLDEAMSLMTPRATGAYHLAPQFNTRSAPFIWTADRHGDDAGWVVYYHDGIGVPESEHFNAYVRAVRTARR